MLNFNQEEVDKFARISLDYNPLHISEEYARKTIFGQRLVHGVLAALIAMKKLKDRSHARLNSIQIDFTAPIFTNVDYSIEIIEKDPNKTLLKIQDGSRLLLKAFFIFESENSRSLTLEKQPHSKTETDIPYKPNTDITDYQLSKKGISQSNISSLMACSYIIGMKIPGESALFSKLELQFSYQQSKTTDSLNCRTHIESSDDRFRLINLSILIESENLLAQGKLRSFSRPTETSSDINKLNRLFQNDNSLSGKVALIVGGSRGIGAVTALALSKLGCQVIVTYLSSSNNIKTLKNLSIGLPGKINAICADAKDVTSYRLIKENIEAQYGQLDFLICSASPAILPFKLELNSVLRINNFIQNAIAMTSVPLAALLPMLVKSKGQVVVFSSSAIHSIPSEWPHYISSKYAIEGLIHSAHVQYPDINFLILRPPRVLTDLTNTILKIPGTITPEEVALCIIRNLKNPDSKNVHILENFSI